MTDAVQVDDSNKVLCILTKEYEDKLTIKDSCLYVSNDVKPHLIVLDENMVKYYDKLISVFSMTPTPLKTRNANKMSTPNRTPSRTNIKTNSRAKTNTGVKNSNVHTLEEIKTDTVIHMPPRQKRMKGRS